MSAYLSSIKLVSNHDVSDQKVFMSVRLMKRLGIQQKQDLHICLGKKVKKGKVEVHDIPRDEIQLSDSLLNEFSINSKSPTFLVKHLPEKKLLYIGPVIGLVTDLPSINKNQEPNFGSIHAFCKELHQTITKNGGFFFVFNYQDLSDEGVHGYYFDNNQWVYSSLPLPDVVYNRIHSRRSEQTRVFKTFRSILERFAIPMFNDRFLSKWEVYQHLMQDSQIHPHIPVTNLFSQETLYDFFDRYESIFIKPVHGSQGRNIIKLVKEDDHVLLQTSRTAHPPKNKKYEKKEVFYHLKPYLHNRIYIIQQGISLINYENNAVDFRVLVHKNHQNLWEVTSIVARVAGDQQFVSNLAKGGTSIKPFVALTATFDKETSIRLISLLKELSMDAAEMISLHTNGITGELGIDIGVDEAGKPWIIEVNSKPSKSFEDPSTKIRPSAKAIIKFCMKLALDGVLEMEE